MGADFSKYLSIAGLLIFVYLIVKQGAQTTSVINSLSSANTNAISALQGNPVQPSI